MSKLNEGSSSSPYSVVWKRPDGRKVTALWMKYGELDYTISEHPSSVMDICGRQLPVSDRILIRTDVVYFVY